MARNHAVAYQALNGVELVAAHDHDDRAADRFCADFGIRRAGLSELLETVDAVSVCTWPASHAALTLAALQAGVHVLCEKPPATNADEAAEMLEMAGKQGLVLTYGLLYRHVFRDIAGLVTDVGRPYKINAKWLRRFGFPSWSATGYLHSSGGALTDLGVHMIDLALYLLGNPDPTLVHAAAWNHRTQEFYGQDTSTDDSAFVFIRLDNGCSVVVDVAYSTDMTDDEHVSVEVQGSRGTLLLAVPTTQTTFTPELFPRFHRCDETSSSFSLVSRRPRLVREAIQDQLADFCDAVRTGQPPLVPASEAVTLQRILDLAVLSAQTKNRTIGVNA
ncbi:Gfo/Idh/MocA family oxidoreductase [Micromonospora olivasterospora]|uniref:Putative dehydrogenase n=2 Tax=Micromonospora olivasterospora TaxID=1880 RepID=A0A562I4H0_MICOL|nr:putative dehydrogenase [Micromonospora olivasterospora]